MNKIIFFANFMLIFSKALGAPLDNFKNSSIDKVDVCQMLHLTKDQTDQFLKSKKERETVDEKCKRFSQRMNEILINQTTRIRLDNVENSTYSLLESSSADKCINEYFENLSQTPKKQKRQSTSFSNNRKTSVNQNKISTKHKTPEKQEVPILKHVLEGIEKINADKKRKRTTNIENSQIEIEQENPNIINFKSPKMRKIKTDDDLLMIKRRQIKNQKPTYQIPITTWLNKIRNNPEKEIIEELKRLKNTNERNNVKEKTKHTLLIMAVNFGKSELAKYLIGEGAEVNAKDKDGKTALFYALQQNNEDISKILINNGASIEILNQNHIVENFGGITFSRILKYEYYIKNQIIDLRNAILKNKDYKNKLETLVKEINIKNFKIMDDLFIKLIEQGNQKLVEQLIENGININAENKSQEKAIIVALENGYPEIAKLLIQHHADVNVCSINGNTALMIALEKDYQDIFDLLIQESNNLDINAQNEDGDSALTIAASRAKDPKDIENIKTLIKRNAYINIQNKNGHTALIKSIIGGSIDATKLLLKNGAYINIRNKTGNSELLKVLYTRDNNDEIIKLLIDNLVGIYNCQELIKYLQTPFLWN